MSNFFRRKNVYTCPRGHRTVTVDSAVGVTPFMIGCKAADCCEMAQSSMYRVGPDLVASHEWYVPSVEEFASLDDATREHCKRGGLLLRPYKRAEFVLHSLPCDVSEAFEQYKLCILRHKLAGWYDISRAEMIESLKALINLAKEDSKS